jgi:phenylpropionate dioxygenase-like ring-hydroxylating dioxygenase large terminal subunit
MNRETEISLLKRCTDLANSNSREMTAEGSSLVARYVCDNEFQSELAYMRKLPMMVVHSSELPEKGSFIALNWLEDFPLLLTRDMDGKVHAFANACQHRGSRLEAPGEGCKKRLMCPYHAWTYDMTGYLKSLPHKEGFPSIDPEKTKLKELPSQEFNGFVWVQREGESELDVASYLGEMGEDFNWLAPEEHVLFEQTEQVWKANWKVIVEGGLESYHFKIAHRNTIAPLFRDALSVFDEFGPHFRSVLAKESIKFIGEQPVDQWNIREHANVLYSVFPMNSILVQPDHFATIVTVPIAPDKTRVSIKTYVPKNALNTEKQKAHWKANFEFTWKTLLEDFELAEQIQQGMKSGANEDFYFGRFENALTRFHEINQQMIKGSF